MPTRIRRGRVRLSPCPGDRGGLIPCRHPVCEAGFPGGLPAAPSTTRLRRAVPPPPTHPRSGDDLNPRPSGNGRRSRVTVARRKLWPPSSLAITVRISRRLADLGLGGEADAGLRRSCRRAPSSSGRTGGSESSSETSFASSKPAGHWRAMGPTSRIAVADGVSPRVRMVSLMPRVLVRHRAAVHRRAARPAARARAGRRLAS